MCAKDADVHRYTGFIHKAVQAKTLIILGDHDVPLVESALAMSRLMPHANLAVFPGGHGKYLGEIADWKEADGPPEPFPSS